MKLLALIALLACALGATTLQDVDMTPAAPLDQHVWLRQLAGTWSVTSEATMEPGADPMRMESTETARMLGDLWLLAEGSADLGGTPLGSQLTLGYDPAQEAFVGTWIDTFQSHLWVYRGELDASGKVLTLMTEGPLMGQADRIVRYRDVIEIVEDGHKTLTSSIEMEEGTWEVFMRADYRRKD